MSRGFVIGKENLTKDTLLQLAIVGTLVAVAATSPYFLHRIAKAYFKDKTRRATQARARKLRELEHRKLIAFRELPSGEICVEFTPRGATLVRQYNLETMRIKRPRRWDGTWRIVSYDIPNRLNRASDAFRRKLRQLGLYQLQKSIWVTPFDCREELEFLCEIFGLDFDNYFCYLTTPSLPREQEIKKFFGIS